MKAVRLTTAFAVALGVVLPLPPQRDLISASWGAERGPSAAGASQRRRSAIGLAEQVHGWTSRSAADYQELMRRLSQPAQLNPVADAAARQAAGRMPGDGRGETRSAIETAIGWIHRTALTYQTVVRGLVLEPGHTVIAERSAAATAEHELRERVEDLAKSASDRFDEIVAGKEEQRKAVDAKTADDARIAAAKQAEDEARQVDEGRRVAEAQKAADAKTADDARIAAAKQAEDEARRAEEARRVAEAQKAADAKTAADARIAAAKQVEDEARQVDEARRVAEARKAADAKRAEGQIAAADRKPGEAKVPETIKANVAPSRKRAAAQRRSPRKERAARKGGQSRKVAVAASRKRAKGGRTKKAEHTCRTAVRHTNAPGWYIARRGDTLWKIAARHYGKGRRFTMIYNANARRIADPDRIARCQRIYLPKFRRRG